MSDAEELVKRIRESVARAIELEAEIEDRLNRIYDTGFAITPEEAEALAKAGFNVALGRGLCILRDLCISDRMALWRLIDLLGDLLMRRRAVERAVERMERASPSAAAKVRALLDKLDLVLEVVRRAGYDPAKALAILRDERIDAPPCAFDNSC